VPEARAGTEGAVRAAMFCAFAMVGHQVAAKAARDALFLSTFAVADLASMISGAALASVAFATMSGRALARGGPARLVPAAFAASGALHLGLWVLAPRAPRLASVALYLVTVTLGAVLVSGFWSIVNERFDPRTARKSIGRIAGAGTLGGLAGGIAAERLAALAGVIEAFPLLAGLHFACAWAARRTSGPMRAAPRAAKGPSTEGGLRVVATDRYLRSIAGLVVAGSIASTLVDVAFKTQAVAAVGSGSALMRLFALLYTASALVAFVVQVFLGRASLERLGLAGTIALLPATVTAGALAALAASGQWVLGGLRLVEAAVRTSVYRLGYELLYTPVPPARKRGSKTIIDVALDRAGEALAAGMLPLALASPAPIALLLAAAAAAGAVGVWLARSLHHGYVRVLEQSLLSRAVSLDLRDVMDSTTRRTVESVGGSAAAGSSPIGLPIPAAAEGLDTGLFVLTWTRRTPVVAPAPPVPPPPARPRADGVVARLAELRSGDAARAKAALRNGPLDKPLVPQALTLLAWDEVASAASEALRPQAGHAVGQLVDALVATEEEFAVRRRVARLLSEVAGPRATEGLVRGLEDPRFEVRWECARVLSGRHRQPAISAEAAFSAVLRETAVPRELWDSRTLLDGASPPRAARPERPGRTSLEHVFTLLSLVLNPAPLKVSLRALDGDDDGLRGTALEYLHVVLPPEVREALWPFLDEQTPRVQRSPSELERELLRAPAEPDPAAGAS
jgi:AAA family ATP:ADP antiporter